MVQAGKDKNVRMGKETGKRFKAFYGKHAHIFRWVFAFALSFAGVCAFPWMMKSGGNALVFTNSIFSVFLFVGLGFLFHRVLEAGFHAGFHGMRRKWILPGMFGFCFSACMVMGVCLDEKGSVPFGNGRMWAAVLVLAGLAALLVRYAWDCLSFILENKVSKNYVEEQENEDLEKSSKLFVDAEPQERSAIDEDRKRETGTVTKGIRSKIRAGSCFRYAGLIFLLYLPVFFAVYPGFFVYDAQDELLQVMTRNFTTHHPLVHVLLLGGIIQLVHKLTGSYNLGIACYTLVQMAVLAGIFGWCVAGLRKRGMRKRFCLLAALYFGLCPVLVMFSLCSAKDGLFAGMLLIMVMLLSRLCRSTEDFLGKKRNMVFLGGASLLMMLLRHNGVYAFLASAVCICFYYYRQQIKRTDSQNQAETAIDYKKIFFVFGMAFVVYLLVHNGIGAFFSADTSENQEMLTVPIQQLARVYQAKEREGQIAESSLASEDGLLSGESLTDGDDSLKADLEILYRYLPPEALAHYTPKVSDGVKIQFHNQAFRQDKGSFLKLWLKWGTENPFTYLNAWFMTSYGYWYPDTVIDVYRGNTVFTYTYEDSSYFGYEVEEPGSRESKIPWLSEFYRKMSLEIFQQKLPVVSMLFSPGFLFWVWAFFLCFWLYQGDLKRVMPYLPVVFCFATVLLGPTYLVRYVVYLWTALPVLLAEFDN